MIYVNGLIATNGGLFAKVNDMEVEVLSQEASGHRANIVVTYIAEGNTKVAISYYDDRSKVGHEVYKYNRNRDELQHYWSRNYGLSLPKKYQAIGERLRHVHKLIFG